MSYIKKITEDDAPLAIYVQGNATASDHMKFNISFDARPHNAMYWLDRATVEKLKEALEEALENVQS